MPMILIDLLVPVPSANQMLKISMQADQFVEQLMSDLHMLREWLQEAQTRMILQANKCRCSHNFKVGDIHFLATRLPPIGYANLP